MGSVLGQLKADKSIKKDSDSLGGNFSVFESGIYLLKVEKAFITFSAKKAMALNIHAKAPDGKELRTMFYMTSGEDKGCKNFYINTKTQEKHYLPGYNQANGLCLLTIGKEIRTLDTDKKNIKLYDFKQGKEVDTEVDMIMELIGQSIYAGVINQTVDKRALDPNTGKYKPTGETRSENEIDKFFRERDKLTVVEIRAKKTEPEFFTSWEKRWTGKVKDKTDKSGGKKSSAKRPSGDNAPTTDLFA